MNFAKFLTTHFLQNTSGRLLLVVAAAGTAVDSVGNFCTYNDGILVVMGVGIIYGAAVIAAVVNVAVVVNRNNFYKMLFYFHLQRLLFCKVYLALQFYKFITTFFTKIIWFT